MGLGSNLTSYQVAAITFLCKAGPSKCEITELTGVSKHSVQRWTNKLNDDPDGDVTLQKKPPGIRKKIISTDSGSYQETSRYKSISNTMETERKKSQTAW